MNLKKNIGRVKKESLGEFGDLTRNGTPIGHDEKGEMVGLGFPA